MSFKSNNPKKSINHSSQKLEVTISSTFKLNQPKNLKKKNLIIVSFLSSKLTGYQKKEKKSEIPFPFSFSKPYINNPIKVGRFF